jgi:hypothetical protein
MVWIASLSGAGAFANIPQTFTHLQMRVFGRSTETGTIVNMYARFSGDANAAYLGHALAGDGSAVSSSSYLGYDAWEIGAIPAASTTANVFGSHIIDILDYTNTNKFKTIRSLIGYDANGSGNVSLRSGLWRNTGAITSISITYPPFATGSRIDLYGITSSSVTGA